MSLIGEDAVDVALLPIGDIFRDGLIRIDSSVENDPA
jgi:hypothetical protein